MKLIMNFSDFEKKPCIRYDELPKDKTFDAVEEIRNRGNRVRDIQWLIRHCHKAHTLEMLAYFKSLNPSYVYVRWVIRDCEFAQTIEMLEFYRLLNPTYHDVSMFIMDCKLAQTNEMLKYYISLNPDHSNVEWFIGNCEFAEKHKHFLLS